MSSLARAGRTGAGIDKSAVLGVGMAWAEVERSWELQAERAVDDREVLFGVALSERGFDFVTEGGKSVKIQEDKKTTHTLSSRCEISLSCH